MRAGLLRHRIALQKRTKAADGGGGYTETWADWIETWASVEPLRGAERWSAQQITANVSHKVTMRHQAGVTTRHRVRFGGRTMRIDAVLDPAERREMLELLCEEEHIE